VKIRAEADPTKNDAYIAQIADLLSRKYDDFAHHNKTNPLEELIFILCSLTTTEKVYLRTFKALRKRFHCFSDLADAPISKIAATIREGGQQLQKAIAIKAILNLLKTHFGKPTLAPLKMMSNNECEAFLTSLPRVGTKVARCVMLYSLGRMKFPVDTHCWRVATRLGFIQNVRRSKTPSKIEMDRLEALIPPRLRLSLHVNMISLGREFCLAHSPRCTVCPVKKHCASSTKHN